MADDPMILAGEYALRVLEGNELAEAQRRVLADREFAEMVDWWHSWLANMAEDILPVEPSARLWPAIELRLAGRDRSARDPVELSVERDRRGPSAWSMVLAGTGVAALIGAFFLAMPGTPEAPATPAPTAAAQAQQLIAQLTSEDGAIRLAGRIDPASERLVIHTDGFQPSDRQVPVLWVVPDGGAPVSLGAIPASGDFDRRLNAQEQALLVEGALLAVTMEDRGATTYAAPTTPTLVAGALDAV
ncbi:anti-sigma factor [Pseudoblastomonas halimionae]|uniref:Anti-sigma K factor RskA C-terminal domain-containing protein n=1 Tax=Alteriqipengyuania halimionae TaxID=1926630 RepID=A0A6I4U1S0_9SPHN|nr:anti-sigma factor [Alteriqipengyuania halimionae]MXP08863.1 hypothetical protein [Alteriqipengyuania halimionae]